MRAAVVASPLCGSRAAAPYDRRIALPITTAFSVIPTELFCHPDRAVERSEAASGGIS